MYPRHVVFRGAKLALVLALLLSLLPVPPQRMALAQGVESSDGTRLTPQSNVVSIAGANKGKGAPAVDPSAATSQEPQRYIVQLRLPPVSRYEGGIAGLEATSPAVTSAGKLDVTSASAQAYRGLLEEQHAVFLGQTERLLGHSPQVDYQYFLALNGMALQLTADEADAVSRMASVSSVRPDWVEYALTDAGPAFMGAARIWNDFGIKGEGVVVGIVDTGINMDHPSFADVGEDGYNHSNPRGKFYGWCDPAYPDYDSTLVCNDKLIGAWSGDADSPEDAAGHGTHTASTTAGNVVNNPTLNAPTTSVSVSQISGVAPHANIIAYNIEGAPGSGSASGAVIIAATEQAIADQVDVINYSFGAGGADPWTSADHWYNVRAAGIFVATSAANSGSAPDTIGSPANAPWVLTVGASSHDRRFGNTLMDLTGGDTAPPADIEGEGITSGYGPASIVYAGAVDPNNVGCDVPYAPNTFSGEIVVCDYNSGPQYGGRVNKSVNLADAGAGGFILINRSDWGEALMVDSYAVPGLGISYASGEALKAWLASGSGHMGSIRGVLEEPARGDIMAGFSSRGPNGPAPDIIKPDVTAPGRRIFAAIATSDPADPPEFDVYQGTSMSSPHAAGAAALLRAVHPDWTPAQVQSALMTTALSAGVLKEDAATPADPFDMGAGRVDLTKAADAGLLLDIPPADFLAANPADGGDPATLNLPSLAQDKCIGSCSWSRTVENVLGTATNWTASATGNANISLTVSPSSFSLDPGATQEIQVTATLMDVPVGEWAFGSVNLTETGGAAPDAHLPVAASFSAGSLPDSVEIVARRNAGSQLISDLKALEITDLAVNVSGLTKGTITEKYLVSDPTNDDPYDGSFDPSVDGTFFINLEVPDNADRLIAETVDSESGDMDLFVGAGATPTAETELCASTSGTAIEFCELVDPAPGAYWVLVQNWEETNGPALPGELVVLSTAVVPGTDSGNMHVEGPASIPADTLFDLRIFWDEPSMAEGDRWYGSFDIGSNPGSPGDIGTVPVTVVRIEDDVTKTVDKSMAKVGDTLTYQIVVEPNITDEDLTYQVTDTLPPGVTYVEGSATGGATVANGVVTWTGVMPVPEVTYAIETSVTDPAGCRMPFSDADGVPDAYVDLEAFGLFTEPGIEGDTVAFSADFLGGAFTFFGTPQGETINFGDDGFAFFDPSTPGDEPWTHMPIPTASDPNNMMAIFWRDMEIVYDAATNRGVTLADLTDDNDVPIAGLIEYDDVEDWPAGGSPAYDFEVLAYYDAAPDRYEYIFAYDNLSGDVTVGSIGLEDVTGTAGVQYAYDNIAVTDGMAVCFDQIGAADPAVLTYQVTVETTYWPQAIINSVEHVNDNPGAKVAETSVAVLVGYRLSFPTISK